MPAVGLNTEGATWKAEKRNSANNQKEVERGLHVLKKCSHSWYFV